MVQKLARKLFGRMTSGNGGTLGRRSNVALFTREGVQHKCTTGD